MSAAVSLYRLLEAADREGKTVPHGTGQIVVDGRLCTVVARETLIEAADVYEAFYGVPVKACRAILRWAQREAPGDLTEQTEMVLRWRSKNYPREHAMQERGVA